LRNNIRLAAVVGHFGVVAWVIGRLANQFFNHWETSITAGIINTAVLTGLLINWQDDEGRLGLLCRAITKPFVREPE
jgi:hypothetical protein